MSNLGWPTLKSRKRRRLVSLIQVIGCCVFAAISAKTNPEWSWLLAAFWAYGAAISGATFELDNAAIRYGKYSGGHGDRFNKTKKE